MDGSNVTPLHPQERKQAGPSLFADPEDARKRLAEYLAANPEVTRGKAAREMGYTTPVISAFLNGKYEGNNEEVAARADQWLAQRAARETLSLLLPETGGWVETPTSAQIVETLEYAKLAGDLVLVYGEPGTGKTITFRHYALTRRNVWCVTATPAHASVTGFLASVALAVGVRGARYQRARLHDEVVGRIKGTQGLLIVDEAQFLTRHALEEARALYDACGETAGLCLGGDARLHAAVHGEDFAQLSSRVGAPLFLPGPREGDAEKIVEALKIGDGRARKFLLGVARRGEAGGIRMLVKAARLAGRKAAGRPMQLHHLEEAHAALAGAEA